MSNHVLVQVSRVRCHMPASSANGCAFVYFILQCHIEYSRTISFIASPGCPEAGMKAIFIANCISWVPRLTLLDLQTNWTYKCALRIEFFLM